MDGFDARASLQIRVDDHDLFGPFFLGETVEDRVDGLSKDDAVRSLVLAAPLVEVRGLRRLDVLKDVGNIGSVSFELQVLNQVMPMSAPFRQIRKERI
jgi:hypothetical protein